VIELATNPNSGEIKMKSVSTGFGLCVLGSCILGAAWLPSTRADGTTNSLVTQGKLVPTNTPFAAEQRGAASAITDCAPAITPWFEQTPRFVNTCANVGWIGCVPLSVADVNQDGTTERFSASWRNSEELVRDGHLAAPPEEDRIRLYAASAGQAQPDGAVSFQYSRVFEAPNLGSFVLQKFPTCKSAVLYLGLDTYYGFSDVDGDGDLDLIAVLYVDDGSHALFYGQVWFKNTGFQYEAPLQGDLDGDGFVGGSDISLLLLNWSDH
jgi:hypothetical protein